MPRSWRPKWRVSDAAWTTSSAPAAAIASPAPVVRSPTWVPAPRRRDRAPILVRTSPNQDRLTVWRPCSPGWERGSRAARIDSASTLTPVASTRARARAMMSSTAGREALSTSMARRYSCKDFPARIRIRPRAAGPVRSVVSCGVVEAALGIEPRYRALQALA